MISSIDGVEKLKGVLLEYKTQREKGMNAGHIASKLDIPLKDVISFLIEENVLTGEQIDLELARVLLSKNPELRDRIWKRFGLPPNLLDKALVTQDQALWEYVWEQYKTPEIFPMFSSVVFFLFAMNMSYSLVLSICALFLSFFYKDMYRRIPKSDIEKTLEILNKL